MDRLRVFVVGVAVLAAVCHGGLAAGDRAGRTEVAFEMHRVGTLRSEACCVGDFNGDGKLDILAGSFWYENPTWEAHRFRSIEELIDPDGNKHVVDDQGKRFYAHNGGDPGADEPLGVYWYELQRRGGRVRWVKHVISYDQGIGAGLNIPVADIDGDGDMDLVVTGKWGGPVWFENKLK